MSRSSEMLMRPPPGKYFSSSSCCERQLAESRATLRDEIGARPTILKVSCRSPAYLCSHVSTEELKMLRGYPSGRERVFDQPGSTVDCQPIRPAM